MDHGPIDAIRDPDTDRLRSSEPPPEHYEDVTDIPRPRAAACRTMADHATDAGRPGRGANLNDSLEARA
jgi:hypothetical protein